MDAVMPEVLDTAPAETESNARPEKPARLLILALVWVLGGIAAGLVSVVGLILVIRLHNGVGSTEPARAWTATPVVGALLSLAVTDVMLLLAAWRRASVVGRGDTMTGLGDGPIRRPRLLVAFAIVGAASVFGWIVLLGHWMKPPDDTGILTLLRDTRAAGPFMEAAMLVCMIGLSPLWEELFFRGWLWTGLRRHWRPLPVMVATALPWLLLHMADGLFRPLFLIPAAIILSLARQYCGGVRASIALHILNNLIATGLVVLALPAGHT